MTTDTYASERMRIDDAGNVGIGVTAPWGHLHVTESAVQGAAFFENSNNSGNIYPAAYLMRTRADSTAPVGGFGASLVWTLEGFTDSSSVDAANITGQWEVDQTNNTTARDSSLVFATMADNSISEKMRITSAGNVGIGTGNPQAALDVAGEVRVGNASTSCSVKQRRRFAV
ncbi:MAG: hypothetical protein HC883_02270 [Bdellovibrionaceae bacterium]|nr:hypothetical protein [Pseudobdellovibrionaceae bacterium]